MVCPGKQENIRLYATGAGSILRYEYPVSKEILSISVLSGQYGKQTRDGTQNISTADRVWEIRSANGTERRRDVEESRAAKQDGHL